MLGIGDMGKSWLSWTLWGGGGSEVVSGEMGWYEEKRGGWVRVSAMASLRQ
jgi:hypothetical protein